MTSMPADPVQTGGPPLSPPDPQHVETYDTTLRDGVLLTPPLAAGCLAGLTRDSIITIAEAEGIPVRETDLVRTDLYLADEAFFTGTAAEVVPIREVDDRVLGDPGPITRRLQEIFSAATTGRDERYRDWLEPVA